MNGFQGVIYAAVVPASGFVEASSSTIRFHHSPVTGVLWSRALEARTPIDSRPPGAVAPSPPGSRRLRGHRLP